MKRNTRLDPAIIQVPFAMFMFSGPVAVAAGGTDAVVTRGMAVLIGCGAPSGFCRRWKR